MGRAEGRIIAVRGVGDYFTSLTTALHNGQHGFAKIGRDITDKKRQESEQVWQLQQSRNTSKLKDEFFAVMSHELKHPLNLIQLNGELMTRLPLVRGNAVAGRALDTILGAVRSQARIIDDLLDLSRINTGKLKLNRGPVLLQQLLSDIAAVAKDDAAEERILIELQLPEDAQEPLVIDADPVRIEQIIWNLLNNALKFTDAGGRICLRLVDEGSHVRFDVQDTGQGIAAESLPLIFDLFGQVPEHRHGQNRGGLGIGLALVRELVEAHHGRVEARSAGLGLGATFSVWLPHYSRDEQPMVGELDLTPGDFSGLKVLIVDDSEDILEIMKALMELEGAEVTLASNGLEALERLDGDSVFDLVLSDLGMPVMNGLELIGRIRADSRFNALPVVALTGFGASQDKAEALTAGFNAHVDKPVAFEVLQETVRAVLGR